MTSPYPDDSVQSLVGEWWTRTSERALQRGRVVWAFVPHVESNPKTLQAVGRGVDPGDHTQATFKMSPMRAADAHARKGTQQRALPVAALPLGPGEVYGVYPTKRRPMIVLSKAPADVPKTLQLGGQSWQAKSAVLAAPAYGVARKDQRGGWPEALVTHIRHAAFPQYMWDVFPGLGEPAGSIVRFDQVSPIGTGPGAYELTDLLLSDAAMGVVDEWFEWFLTGALVEGSTFHTAQGILLER